MFREMFKGVAYVWRTTPKRPVYTTNILLNFIYCDALACLFSSQLFSKIDIWYLTCNISQKFCQYNVSVHIFPCTKHGDYAWYDFVGVHYCIVVEHLNTLRPRKNGRHFADDMFKCIFLNENIWIPIEISLKIVPRGSISNIPALVQIMAWRRSGDKPLSEPMMIRLPTHICVTRPKWVNEFHCCHWLNVYSTSLPWFWRDRVLAATMRKSWHENAFSVTVPFLGCR